MLSVYRIDLNRIGGKGEFSCPVCGIEINPVEETDEKYKIIDADIGQLFIRCENCKSIISLENFINF